MTNRIVCPDLFEVAPYRIRQGKNAPSSILHGEETKYLQKVIFR